MIKLNGHVITPTIFPDKTSQVWKLKDNFRILYQDTIEWDFENEAEFMHVAQLVALCKKESPYNPDIYMPFLPYGRQDKKISNETTFAREVFLSLMSTFGCNLITLDAHSSDIKGRFTSISPDDHIKDTIRAVGPTVILFPDSGASTRYTKIFTGHHQVYCEKIRDQATGKILEIKVPLNELKKEDRILIVDDICDRGGTFIGIAEQLVKAEMTDINLYVTHGIFSGPANLLTEAGIKRVFTYKGEQFGK